RRDKLLVARRYGLLSGRPASPPRPWAVLPGRNVGGCPTNRPYGILAADSHYPGAERTMPRDATETRRKILDAAQGLVLERGFAATSVDAIQAAAGISRGTFFYHFPSKDDIARALLDRYADSDRELVETFR